MKKETRVNHPPEVVVPADNRPLVAPIYQSVKFEFETVEAARDSFRGLRPGFSYSRVANPTLRQLELTLAELQGRDACLVTASGVAAVNFALLALCKQGDHIVHFAEMYPPTRSMVRRILGRFGVASTLLSIEDLDALERTLATRKTRVVLFESPTNPAIKVGDVERIAGLAHAHDALAVLDNTFAGFHNHGQYPLDLYVHSLTKYASGHGDVMGGAIIGARPLIDSMRADLYTLGPTLDPHAAWLIQRGLKTYFLRYERQCANALAIASFLDEHAAVKSVRYPGLPSHPQHDLARAQLHDYGAMLAFEIAGDMQAGTAFAEALSLFARSASLGSTESLVVPPRLLQPSDLAPSERAWSGISPSTVRLSIGIEAVEDLFADLDQALARACPGA
jgi:cystathionine beta-lyase/cystathionine gamma-synthase